MPVNEVYPAKYGVAALRHIWLSYRALSADSLWAPADLLQNFYFCILGGYSIPFELNDSAYRTLHQKGYTDPQFYSSHSSDTCSTILETELAATQFRPLTAAGQLRRYRFPNAKAHSLVAASKWLHDTCDYCLETILIGSENEQREILMTCPGLGFKTASWFLRNVGRAVRLAIIDVHLHRVLSELSIIPAHLTPGRHYLRIEQYFLDACDAIPAPPAEMDLIIWSWERGSGFGGRGTQPSL
jgi:thermostable 8-oxoguanine DNA glycosylase